MKPIRITVTDEDGIVLDEEHFAEDTPMMEGVDLIGLAKHYMRYFVIPRLAPGQIIKVEELK